MKRSMLFTPGNNPKNIASAGFLPGDRIIFDLEDSVALQEKDAARILVRNAIRAMDYPKEVIVRINALTSPYWEEDVAVLSAAQPDYIMLPKCETPEDILQLQEAVEEAEKEAGISRGKMRFIALLETALGIENAFLIAKSSPRLSAMMLGAEDLVGSIHGLRTASGEEILYARGRIVNAAYAAGVDGFDTPWTSINDLEGLKRDAELARQMGFTGKTCIHPSHAAVINSAFSPTPQEIEYARGVMAAIAKARENAEGVVSFQGKMVDAPVENMARQILAMAEELGR